MSAKVQRSGEPSSASRTLQDSAKNAPAPAPGIIGDGRGEPAQLAK
jgi:hypothetical protein